jgi:hypothetical protein
LEFTSSFSEVYLVFKEVHNPKIKIQYPELHRDRKFTNAYHGVHMSVFGSSDMVAKYLFYNFLRVKIQYTKLNNKRKFTNTYRAVHTCVLGSSKVVEK